MHYLSQDDYKPHDILLCIGTGKTVNDRERLRYHGDQFYLKTPAEMAAMLPGEVAKWAAVVKLANVSVD